MSLTLWLPGAERVTGPHAAGGSMAGGPPRCTHHITWDALGPQGQRPRFDNVRNYLVSMGFEPTLMIDPFTGRRSQFLPGNRSAYALRNAPGGVQTNRMGTAHLQVEWFFSPGCIVGGERYDDLTHTPMRGLDEVLAMCESYGIPSRWAAGVPTWRGVRSTATWTRTAGHYGHSQVPENTHTDPGPMPLSIAPPPRPPAVKPAPKPLPAPTPVQEDDDMAVIVKDPDGPKQYVTDFLRKRWIEDPSELADLEAAGLKRVPVKATTLARIPEVTP